MLHKMCEAYGGRPSEYAGIYPDEENLLAFAFDREVFSFGRGVDNKLTKTNKKGKRLNKIEDLLGLRRQKMGLTDLMLMSGQDVIDG